jgi:hypothetical protein
VTNPVTNIPGRTYVKIGLNRTPTNQPDCDYWYQTGLQNNQPTPVVGVGGVGSVQWGSPIITPLQYPGTFDGQILLVKRNSGGASSVGLYGAALLPYVSIDATYDNQLNWSFNPINFAQVAPWQPGDVVDYYLYLLIQTQESTPQFCTVSVLSTGCIVTDNACAEILPLVFVWGCLAAGTGVTLADGGVRAVERIAAGDRVRADAAGRVLTVRDTVVGIEAKPMIRVTGTRGRAVLVTETHPFLTERGVRLARDLAAGDVVHTDAGPSALVSVEPERYDGPIYNLVLGEGAERDALGEDQTTHYANGFLVGDDQMQAIFSDRAEAARRRVDPLTWLPEKFHHDYHSARKARALAGSSR